MVVLFAILKAGRALGAGIKLQVGGNPEASSKEEKSSEGIIDMVEPYNGQDD